MRKVNICKARSGDFKGTYIDCGAFSRFARAMECEAEVDMAWDIYAAPCPCTLGVPAKIAHKDGLPIERLLRALAAWQAAKRASQTSVGGGGQSRKRGSK